MRPSLKKKERNQARKEEEGEREMMWGKRVCEHLRMSRLEWLSGVLELGVLREQNGRVSEFQIFHLEVHRRATTHPKLCSKSGTVSLSRALM